MFNKRIRCNVGIAPVVGFLPTIAKQLGYSSGTVGAIYTCLPIMALLCKPVAGVVFDKFPVKRIAFVTSILTCGLAAFAFGFIQRLSEENAARSSCDVTTTNTSTTTVCSYDGSPQTLRCPSARLEDITFDRLVECQVREKFVTPCELCTLR